MAVAAAMAGEAPDAVAALPDSRGMPDKVVLPAGHTINYGHPILTDIRLAGAIPILAGNPQGCSLRDLEQALATDGVACLLLVSSRLVQGHTPDLAAAVALAHARGVPAIIDGAAQDMRLPQLLASGADAVLASAHKYLAAPTAGLVVGSTAFVRAFRAQETGIGRAMKAGKEAIVGVLAALDARSALDLPAWRAEQQAKVDWFIDALAPIAGLHAQAVPDPAGMPFARVCLTVDPVLPGWSAQALARTLRSGTPSIWVMGHVIAQQQLQLELVPLRLDELGTIVQQLAAARTAFGATPVV
jgi:L-seryl-tRNA(Ser) seleniumtransferase